jgi:hypothetical protein
MQFEEQTDSSSEVNLDGEQSQDESQQPGETEDSLLSVVKKVSEQSDSQSDDDGASESPTEEKSNDTATEAADGEQANGEQTEDYSKLPFNKHPRFRDLVKEKNSYKAQVAEFEPDAKQYREIQSFMQTNSLTAEEVAEGLALMAQIKVGDPLKAYEALSAKAEQLAMASGKKLPPELEERIEQGYIDRDTALELHQSRLTAQRQAVTAQTQLEQRAQTEQRTQVVTMANAVATWEQATKASDPDFDLKADLVKDRVRAFVATNGMPKTAEEALKVSKDAYESVTKTLLKARGDKKPMSSAVGGKVNGSAAAEPKSLLDVIRRASAGA